MIVAERTMPDFAIAYPVYIIVDVQSHGIALFAGERAEDNARGVVVFQGERPAKRSRDEWRSEAEIHELTTRDDLVDVLKQVVTYTEYRHVCFDPAEIGSQAELRRTPRREGYG